jgi:tetratricopeptide (TPR) repeat protein
MYGKAIAIDPKYAYPYNDMGYLYMAMGQYAAAIPLLLKSIELEPNITRYVNLGIAHYCLGEPAKAKDYFDRALACPDKPQDTHHQLDKTTACLGNEKTDEAMVLLQAISAKQLPQAFLKDFFTDLQMLAGSPQPPLGIGEFIAGARQLLNYEL